MYIPRLCKPCRISAAQCARVLPAYFALQQTRGVRRTLEVLQDKVPPRPFEDVDQVIIQELGAPSKEIFSTFNTVATAAASLAQVELLSCWKGCTETAGGGDGAKRAVYAQQGCILQSPLLAASLSP